MTTAGWIFMLCSLSFVLALNIACFIRVLRRPASSAPEDTHEA
jgi:hypothetical protein